MVCLPGLNRDNDNNNDNVESLTINNLQISKKTYLIKSEIDVVSLQMFGHFFHRLNRVVERK